MELWKVGQRIIDAPVDVYHSNFDDDSRPDTMRYFGLFLMLAVVLLVLVFPMARN